MLLVCLGASAAFAQHKIVMINGKVIEASEYTVGDMFISYKKTDGNGSMKAVDRYDVFAIQRQDGTEEMIYVSDSIDYTVAEAREYIKGEQTAHELFNRRPIQATSILVGGAASLLSFYSLPVPMLYAVAVGRFNTKNIKVASDTDKHLLDSEAYREGYQREVRNLKIQQSLKWGYISLGLGLTGLLIYGATSK